MYDGLALHFIAQHTINKIKEKQVAQNELNEKCNKNKNTPRAVCLAMNANYVSVFGSIVFFFFFASSIWMGSWCTCNLYRLIEAPNKFGLNKQNLKLKSKSLFFFLAPWNCAKVNVPSHKHWLSFDLHVHCSNKINDGQHIVIQILQN